MNIKELITRAAEDFEIPPIVFINYRRKMLNSHEVLSLINDMYTIVLERVIQTEHMTEDELSLLSLETKAALERMGVFGNYYPSTPTPVSPRWILLSRMYEASPWKAKLGELSQFTKPVQDEILLGIAARIDLNHAMIPRISAKTMEKHRLRLMAIKENKHG